MPKYLLLLLSTIIIYVFYPRPESATFLFATMARFGKPLKR